MRSLIVIDVYTVGLHVVVLDLRNESPEAERKRGKQRFKFSAYWRRSWLV